MTPPITRHLPLAPRPVPCPTVFIVDDDPAVLKSLSRLLRSAGLSCATFSSPREFLDCHDPNASGCLVLDIAMPGLNGLELRKPSSPADMSCRLFF